MFHFGVGLFFSGVCLQLVFDNFEVPDRPLSPPIYLSPHTRVASLSPACPVTLCIFPVGWIYLHHLATVGFVVHVGAYLAPIRQKPSRTREQRAAGGGGAVLSNKTQTYQHHHPQPSMFSDITHTVK